MCRFFIVYIHEADTASYVGDFCHANEFPEVAKNYPKEGIEFMPHHPELEWDKNRTRSK